MTGDLWRPWFAEFTPASRLRAGVGNFILACRAMEMTTAAHFAMGVVEISLGQRCQKLEHSSAVRLDLLCACAIGQSLAPDGSS